MKPRHVSIVVIIALVAMPLQSSAAQTPELYTAGVAKCEESGSSKGAYKCQGVADGCVGTWWSDSNDPDSDDKHWGTAVCTGDPQ